MVDIVIPVKRSITVYSSSKAFNSGLTYCLTPFVPRYSYDKKNSLACLPVLIGQQNRLVLSALSLSQTVSLCSEKCYSAVDSSTLKLKINHNEFERHRNATNLKENSRAELADIGHKIRWKHFELRFCRIIFIKLSMLE